MSIGQRGFLSALCLPAVALTAKWGWSCDDLDKRLRAWR